jgi:hypothetical protein
LLDVVPRTGSGIPGTIESRPTEYGDREISPPVSIHGFSLNHYLIVSALVAIKMQLFSFGGILGDGNRLIAWGVVPGSLKGLVDFIAADANVTLNPTTEGFDNRLDVLIVTGYHVNDDIRFHFGHLLFEFRVITPVPMDVLGPVGEGNIVLPSVITNYRMASIQEFFNKIRTAASRPSNDQYLHYLAPFANAYNLT